jgi:hypothetical protein
MQGAPKSSIRDMRKGKEKKEEKREGKESIKNKTW